MRESNTLTLALVFVVAARLCIAQLGRVVSYPFRLLAKYVPASDDPSFPRYAKLKARLGDYLLNLLPEWVEYRGNYVFLLKTTYKIDTLRGIAGRIPDRYYDYWHRFGLLTMVSFLVVWAFVMLILLGVSLGLFVSSIPDLLTVDWASLFHINYGTADPTYELPGVWDLLVGLATLLALSAVAILLMGVVMLFFLPGLLIHEFGHFASMEYVDCGVSHYGIILTGPVLGGAFVQPERDMDELAIEESMHALSAGVANTLLWGMVLTSIGLVLAGGSLTDLLPLYDVSTQTLTSNPVGKIILLLGIVELSNAQLNAFPGGPVDGGRFMQVADAEWGLTEKLRSTLPV